MQTECKSNANRMQTECKPNAKKKMLIKALRELIDFLPTVDTRTVNFLGS